MRIFVSILVLCFIASAQKRFTSEYFVKKYNLKLPKVTEDMLDVSELTHTSDSWEYFYQGKTEKLDSVVRMLTIERFPCNLQTDKYRYTTDTVYVSSVSILIDSGGDTSSATNYKYVDNFRTQIAYKPKTNCIWKSRFDERGIKLLDVRKCPHEKEFSGQVFRLEKHENYLESIPVKDGTIDSNNIRRYYLAPFDSIVADFLVEKNKEPLFFNLTTYNEQHKSAYKYNFDVFRSSNPIVSYNYHTYDNSGRLKRAYLFNIRNWSKPEDGFNLTNLTEYEYDKLGRKIRTTTRVKPDKKQQKVKDRKE